MAKNSNNNEYINQLLKEQQSLDSHQCANAVKLVQQEIERIRSLDSDDARRDNHIVVHTGKQFCLKVKIHIPIDEHPNFNYVGKLLGPKGSSLQQLQEATQTRMAILGRGSMKDKRKEEELRTGGDPKYLHLNEDLHVEISAYAPPAEAYRRMAGAVGEIQRFLIPENVPYRGEQEYFDDMRQYPFREMGPPMADGKPPKMPYPKDGPPPPMPPRGGPPAPARPMPPPMAPPMRDPARRPPPLAQSTYATPEAEEWAPAAPRRSPYNAAPPPPRPAARGYDDGADDYNSYGDGYADYNAGNSASYYDYSADADGGYPANDYADERGPVRNAGAPRGRNAARLQNHPYAGATRRGY